MRSIVLKGGFITTPLGVSRSDLLIKDQKIVRVDSDLSGEETVDCRGCYVLPGFRDQHIHDIKGFMESPDDPERLQKVSRSLAAQGVTAYILATMAAPTEHLAKYLLTIRRYMDSGKNGLYGARLEGANIEGTFIRKECAGAQPYEHIVSPNEPDARQILEGLLKTGAVKVVNIVPDFGTDLIRQAASKGVIVGCGHTLATAEQLAEGFEHGLKFIVHLTNGGMGRSFKPFNGGGAYEGALVLPLFIELITDRYHVDFRYVSDVIWRRVLAGRGHEVIAVTDGIYPVLEEVPDEEFRVFSTVCAASRDQDVFFVRGRVNKDGSISSVPPNTLCSSRLTMNKAFENILNLLTRDFNGFMMDRKALRLHKALGYVAMFTSSNQALLQEASGETGSIEKGKRADLTVLRVEGEYGEYGVEVVETIVAGKAFSKR